MTIPQGRPGPEGFLRLRDLSRLQIPGTSPAAVPDPEVKVTDSTAAKKRTEPSVLQDRWVPVWGERVFGPAAQNILFHKRHSQFESFLCVKRNSTPIQPIFFILEGFWDLLFILFLPRFAKK